MKTYQNKGYTCYIKKVNNHYCGYVSINNRDFPPIMELKNIHNGVSYFNPGEERTIVGFHCATLEDRNTTEEQVEKYINDLIEELEEKRLE